MRIKLNDKQLVLLKDTLKESSSTHLLSHLENARGNNPLDLADSIADDMRNTVGEKLTIIGFDKNYELTNEGKILEELIDILYVK